MFDSLRKKLGSLIGRIEKAEEKKIEIDIANEKEKITEEKIEEGQQIIPGEDKQDGRIDKKESEITKEIEEEYLAEEKEEEKPNQLARSQSQVARRSSDMSHPKDGEQKEETKVELTKLTQIKHVFSNRIKLSEGDIDSLLEEFRFDLIQADVAYSTSERIIGELKKELLRQDVPKDKMGEHVKNVFRNVLLKVLDSGNEINLFEKIKISEKPFKIVFFGVNGCGKTTTIAKFAHLLMKNNLSVVFAAGDTFRAGAIEQIEKHAQVLGVKVITHKKGADATAVIYDTIAHAKSKGIDVVLADTAGRMQTNVNLMDEMKKICRVNKPDMKIFIGDALTGNDAIEQAERFNNEVGVDAVILTKMDADIKGGSALSIVDTIKKPIIFIGMGQKYDDLVAFDKDWFVSKIVEK